MMQQVANDLQALGNETRAEHSVRYFQAHEGGYGAGDRFIGVPVPDQRKVARKYFKAIELKELENLLQDPIHEHRFTALVMLVLKYEKNRDARTAQELVDLYLRNTRYVNNWDLVDTSAPKILGPFFLDKDKQLLYDLAKSSSLWEQRIAMLTTQYFIKHGQFTTTLDLAEGFLDHPHDLMHKATGWMLREIFDKDAQTTYRFLLKHHQNMPRTMLRYAIEKMDKDIRKAFLDGTVKEEDVR